MSPLRSQARPRGAGGFTLLEIMAVIAIFALVAGITLPNFSGLQIRRLDAAAQELVTRIELARQRAIVTGVPHRLAIDLDSGGYHIEWLGLAPEADDAVGETDPDEPFALDEFGEPLDLSAPRDEQRDFEPLSGTLGRTTWLDRSIVFAGVETTGGWVETGESFIGFEQDGSADATTIVIEHEAGYAVTLEILPLAGNVRVSRESS